MSLALGASPSRASQRINPAVLRAYDIRGVVGRDLTEDDAHALGLAYAAQALSRGLACIALGRDGRLSSPALEAALLAGLIAGGMRVARAGLCATPELGFAAHMLGLDGSIMVTGSHNPPDQNGFKLMLAGEPVHGAALQRLAALPGGPTPGGSVEDLPIRGLYVARLAAAAEGETEGEPPLRVAWDCGNGATGPIVERLIGLLPGAHLVLNAEVDGRFPAHHPDPAAAGNLIELQAAVRAGGFDLGIALDGDGDRIGVVCGEGEILWADQLLLFLAEDLLRDRPAAAVIGDVKASRVLFDGVARRGGRPVMAPSGYVRVREAMRREGAPLAGELSGHIFYADRWHGSDDGLHAAMRLLAALGRAGETLAGFRRRLPAAVASPELRLPCPDDRKAAVVREVRQRIVASGAEASPIDGLRVTTADGWWLLRASGTEPRLTARCEAGDAAGLGRLMATLADQLRLSGVEFPAA